MISPIQILFCTSKIYMYSQRLCILPPFEQNYQPIIIPCHLLLIAGCKVNIEGCKVNYGGCKLWDGKMVRKNRLQRIFLNRSRNKLFYISKNFL